MIREPLNSLMLHSLQLAMWEAEQRKNQRMYDLLANLDTWNPELLMRELENVPGDAERYEPIDWSKATSPKSLAEQVFAAFENVLQRRLPNFTGV